MAGCKTCCDEPSQVVIERVVQSLLYKWIVEGRIAPGLKDCSDQILSANTHVATCEQLQRAIDRLRDELRSGGGNNGGGNMPDLNDFLTDVRLDPAAKTLTFVVKNQSPIVLDVSAFLDKASVQGFDVGTATVSCDMNAKNEVTVTMRSSSGNPVSFKLPIIGVHQLTALADGSGLEWCLTDSTGTNLGKKEWKAPKTTVGQPTFDNASRELTIPITEYVNGTAQPVSELKVTIPATGTTPGADNDTKVQSLSNTYQQHRVDGQYMKDVTLKLTDTAGSEFTTNVLVPTLVGLAAKNSADAGHGMTSIGFDLLHSENGTGNVARQDGPSLPIPRFSKLTATKQTNNAGKDYVKLEMGMQFVRGGTTIDNSEQVIAVDFPVMDTAAAFSPTINNAVKDPTTGNRLPTKIHGSREALLGKPEAFAEVTASDGTTYLMPLYAKA